MKDVLKKLFTPFSKLTSEQFTVVAIGQVVVILMLIEVFHSPIVPTTGDILGSLLTLLQSSNLYENLFASLEITIEAMFYSIVATMFIVYLSTIPFFRPMAQLISKFRYLTLTGLVYLFTIFSSDTGELKLRLLMFGIVPFFVTSFLSVVRSIPQQQIDKSFINRRNAWETLYEVVFVGRLDQLLEVMRQNFAISWVMITTVEAYDMSGGGLGTMMIKSNKHLDLAMVFAMLIIVLMIGLVTDFLLDKIRTTLFKYI